MLKYERTLATLIFQPHSWCDLYDTSLDVIDLDENPKRSHVYNLPMLKPLEDIISLDSHHIEG